MARNILNSQRKAIKDSVSTVSSIFLIYPVKGKEIDIVSRFETYKIKMFCRFLMTLFDHFQPMQ